LAHARHEILMERDPLRELFWAAFDAFLPGKCAGSDGVASNQGIDNTNREKT
jgi:lysophospholipase